MLLGPSVISLLVPHILQLFLPSFRTNSVEFSPSHCWKHVLSRRMPSLDSQCTPNVIELTPLYLPHYLFYRSISCTNMQFAIPLHHQYCVTRLLLVRPVNSLPTIVNVPLLCANCAFVFRLICDQFNHRHLFMKLEKRWPRNGIYWIRS